MAELIFYQSWHLRVKGRIHVQTPGHVLKLPLRRGDTPTYLRDS